MNDATDWRRVNVVIHDRCSRMSCLCGWLQMFYPSQTFFAIRSGKKALNYVDAFLQKIASSVNLTKEYKNARNWQLRYDSRVE